MASSNQYSRGLKFILASLVLLFFLAITVESRAVSLSAPLTPESTGRVNKANRKFVGEAIAYVSLRGKNAFGLSIIAVANINPKKISRVSVYYTSSKKTIANLKYIKANGLYTFDDRVNYTVGTAIHEHKTRVGVWLKKGKKKEALALSGPLANSRTTFLSYLQASQLVATPSGTAKNDAFGVVHCSTTDSVTYFVTAVVNHDLDERVTEISLRGPAPTGADNEAFKITLSTLDHGAKIVNFAVNSTVFYWISNDLTYLVIKTTKNPSGALRGQITPMTTPRARIPVFRNGQTQAFDGIGVTFLDDGSTVIGNLKLALLSGGARPSNKTIGQLDERVAYFVSNNVSNFDNKFRFALPTTINNRFDTRGAVVVFTVAAEVADTNKWNVGLFNQANNVIDSPFTIPGFGNKTYTTVTADLSPSNFPDFLGPQGIYVQVRGSAVANPLYVDRFYTIYYVCSAYVNDLVRTIFFKGSNAENSRR